MLCFTYWFLPVVNELDSLHRHINPMYECLLGCSLYGDHIREND